MNLPAFRIRFDFAKMIHDADNRRTMNRSAKKLTYLACILIGGFIYTGCTVEEHPRHVYVEREQVEPAPVVVEPAPPPPHHDVIIVEPPPQERYEREPEHGRDVVWIRGHYIHDGRHYIWVPGHLERVPHEHANWIPGHWDRVRGGYVWIEGHWR
jgi:hypothetical protein